MKHKVMDLDTVPTEKHTENLLVLRKNTHEYIVIRSKEWWKQHYIDIRVFSREYGWTKKGVMIPLEYIDDIVKVLHSLYN